ncbi:MAG: C40 family peptidase [Bacteroidales bacterium]|nr:C40 family peptidase [Bacteroidales bacterium]
MKRAILFSLVWLSVCVYADTDVPADSVVLADSAVSADSVLLPDTVSLTPDSVLAFALRYVGAPYHYASEGQKGAFDCSGFVRYVLAHFGKDMPHSSREQYTKGVAVSCSDTLQPGDLVFYAGKKKNSAVGHVGIVTEASGTTFSFIHASCSSGVCISRSDEPYYRSRFIGAKRVL